MIYLDINDPKVVDILFEAIDKRVEEKFKELLLLNPSWVKGKVATSGSGSTISVYISNSTTAVDVNNPRGFSLTTGQNVVIRYPNNKNDRDKFIDYIS